MEKKTKCQVSGKTRYSTEGEGKDAIHKIKSHQSNNLINKITGKRKNKGRGKAKQNRVYFCKFCKGWHMTSKIYSSPRKHHENKKIKEYDQLVVTPDKVKNWKEDSIPFPQIQNPNPCIGTN